jgi:NADP-dependent 3-hydroxy acid dehydrogenase YdfG
LRVVPVVLDVCDRAAVFKVLRELDQSFAIDLLIANAGVNEETLKSFDVKTTSSAILQSLFGYRVRLV